jgi:hypothetical protein
MTMNKTFRKKKNESKYCRMNLICRNYRKSICNYINIPNVNTLDYVFNEIHSFDLKNLYMEHLYKPNGDL